MSNYESPIYLTDVEAEELLGVVAAYAADEHGRERPHGLHAVMDQLYRQCGPETFLDLLHGKADKPVRRWCDRDCGYELPDEHKWHETTCGACEAMEGSDG